jgi:hypothetical protein
MKLDHWRGVGDPEADQALAESLASSDLAAINALLAQVRENDDRLPSALPAPLRDFLQRTAAMPPWLDSSALRQAHQLSRERLLSIVTALFCAALPTMYAAAKGARILGATRRMNEDLDRRVNETGRFVLDVLEAGGFSGRGRAIRSIQKVRLMHAMIRRFLPSDGETPINQEDLTGTLFGFSLLTLRASEQLEGPCSAKEREAYYHLWRLVGHFIGVAPELLPSCWDDASELAAEIAERQIAPSEPGRRLAEELVRAMERHLPIPLSLPRRLMAKLLDERVKSALGFTGGGRKVKTRTLMLLSRPFARHLLEVWMQRELRGREPTFRLAPGLGERWDLTST